MIALPPNPVERANSIMSCIERRSYQAELGIDLADLLPPGIDANTPPTVEEIVDFLTHLLDVDLTPDEHTRFVTYMNTDFNGTEVLDDPFDVNEDVDERVRGLLYMLTQHPTYHVR